MKYFFICILLFVILYVLYVASKIFWSGTGELIRLAHPFERKVEHGSPRILVIGDSTGVGVGSDVPEHSIAGRLGVDFPDAYIENHAVSGAVVHDALRQFDGVSENSFDIVLLQIGANDVTHFTNIDRLRFELKELYVQAKKSGKAVFHMSSGSVGFAPAFPHPFGAIFTNRTLLVREMFLDESLKDGIHYIDLYRPRETDIFLTDPKRYFATDSFHPSADGYAVWYVEVRKALLAEGLLSK